MRRRGRYVEEELLHLAILVGLLQVHVAHGVDDQDLAVLGHDALAGARCAGGGGPGLGRSGALGLLVRSVLLLALLLHAAHLPVQGLGRGGIHVLVGRRRAVQAGDAQIVAPGGVARELDVAADKVLLALPAHVERQPVAAASDEDEEAGQHGPEPRAEPGVVVAGALPLGEAIVQEVVVALPAGAAQDVGHDSEARKAVAGGLRRGLDLGRGRALAAVRAGLAGAGLAGDERLLDLVGMQRAGALLVGLVDVVLVRGGRDAEEVVEGDSQALGGLDLIAETEDFLICGGGRVEGLASD